MASGAKSYPKSVIICNEEWDLRFVNEIEGHKNTLGLCDPNIKTLYIKTKQDRLNTLATLIHEMLHAWEEEMERPLPHRWIETLDTPVAQLLLENRDAFLTILGYSPVRTEL